MYDIAENKCRSCLKLFCCKICRENHEINKHGKIADSSCGGKPNPFKTPKEQSQWPQYCVFCHKVFQNPGEFNQQRKCALAIGYRRAYSTEKKSHPIIKICEDNESPPFLQTGCNFQNSKNISSLATSTPMQRSENIIVELGNVFQTPEDIVEESGEAQKIHTNPNQTGTLKRRVTFGSVTTPRASASPTRESTSPIRSSTSPVRSSTSPVRSSTSPIRSSTSPIRSSTELTSNRMSNDNRSAASQGTFHTANEEFLKNNVYTPNVKSPEEVDNHSGGAEADNGGDKGKICEVAAEEGDCALEDSIWVSAVNITNSFLYDAQIVDTDLVQQLIETTDEEVVCELSDADVRYTSESEEPNNSVSACESLYEKKDCSISIKSSDGTEDDSNVNLSEEVMSCEASDLKVADANEQQIPNTLNKTSSDGKDVIDTDNNNTSATKNDKVSLSNNELPEDRKEMFSTPVMSKAEKEAMVHKILRTKFGHTVKISSTPVTFNLLSVQNPEDLVTSGSNLEISNIRPEEIKNEPSTSSSTQNLDKNKENFLQGGLWKSITRVIENAVNMVQNITKSDEDLSIPKSTGSLKRYSSSIDLSDQPALKKFKLTDIKCRRPIRDLPPIAISKNSHVNIVNNFNINIVNNSYNNRVKIYVDKSTQTDE